MCNNANINVVLRVLIYNHISSFEQSREVSHQRQSKRRCSHGGVKLRKWNVEMEIYACVSDKTLVPVQWYALHIRNVETSILGDIWEFIFAAC